MRKIKCLRKSVAGAVSLVFGLAFMTILMAVGLAVDIAVHYAVRHQLQASVDVALLGAMKSVREIPDVEAEFTRLFHANYPRLSNGGDGWYMGTTVMEVQVTADMISDTMSKDDAFNKPTQDEILNNGVYTAEVKVRSPNHVRKIFGDDYEIITARASAVNNTEETQRKAFISLVLDTTGSMAGQPIADLKAASSELINILAGGNEFMSFIWVNIIPYSTSVAFNPAQYPNMRNWVQAPWQPRYDWQVGIVNKAYLANRNPDFPMDPTYDDITDQQPNTERRRFRTPQAQMGTAAIPFTPGFGTPAYWCWDQEAGNQQVATFYNKHKTPMLTQINGLVAEGCTRINTGLGWGYRALSPEWDNLLGPAGFNLPNQYNETRLGFLILMTDGANTVYAGQDPTTSHDDVSTLAMCTAAKARGITVITVGLGAANQALLTSCASRPELAFYTNVSSGLRPIFENLAIMIVQALGVQLVR